ncbi:MAG: hypothetical protein ABIO76_06500 [Ginsengibacter sp.]
MENETKAMHEFEAFATERLNNHQAELNTRYDNEAIDKETLEKAYSQHREIFSTELDEKIQAFSTGQKDQWIKTELQNQKNNYLSKLNFNQSKTI